MFKSTVSATAGSIWNNFVFRKWQIKSGTCDSNDHTKMMRKVVTNDSKIVTSQKINSHYVEAEHTSVISSERHFEPRDNYPHHFFTELIQWSYNILREIWASPSSWTRTKTGTWKSAVAIISKLIYGTDH